MKKRKHFRKKPKDNARGLSVTVFNNNVDGALRIFKKKVKESNLMLELSKKSYYEKPSRKRRQQKNLAKLRNKYKIQKEQKDY